MNTTFETGFLFLIILAAQAFYMYLSSKNQLKSKWYLYILAIPFVTAFPIIMYSQNTFAFHLYEYAIVVCIITVAAADICYAAKHNIDYMTDERCYRFLYAYLMICTTIAWYGSTVLSVKIITAFLLAGSIVICSFVRKHSVHEVLKAPLFALFSLACSWALLKFAI